MTTKTCTVCKETKKHGEFARDKNRKDGRVSQCKACRREYRKANSAKLLESQRRYKAKPESRYRAYKDSARNRGFEWGLTFEEFMQFWKVPCTWCGAEMPPQRNIGLDRVDPSLPYQMDNIESCCKDCNRMKSDLSNEQFEGHLRKILFFLDSKLLTEE